jgi:hypothetical protein
MVEPVREVSRDGRLAYKAWPGPMVGLSGVDEEWMTNVYIAGPAGGVGLLALVSGGHQLGSEPRPGGALLAKGLEDGRYG